MKKLLGDIIDFIFPPRCPSCGGSVLEHGQICGACWGRIDWIADPKCEKCGYPFPASIGREKLLCPDCVGKKTKVNWMRSACSYDGASRSMMLPFKHGAELQYGGPMARAMLSLLGELPPGRAERLAVLPVPLARRRLFRRGYNQAALLARPIAKALGARLDTDSVARRYRADMGHKNARQRAENVRGVFTVRRPERIKGRSVLIVDDVFTTGATFGELAKTLRRAGAAWVGAITFCRAVRAI
ncbi:MAG: ComF family protein [Rickettsiales bacterium]|nr:ComF family protein [Rickettsiales bacterium]